MFVIIKTKRQLRILNNRDKIIFKGRLYLTPKYKYCKFYFKNIKKEFGNLIFLILTLLAQPFLIVYQIYLALGSLNYWCLIYVKKNLKNDIVVPIEIKDEDIFAHKDDN